MAEEMKERTGREVMVLLLQRSKEEATAFLQFAIESGELADRVWAFEEGQVMHDNGVHWEVCKYRDGKYTVDIDDEVEPYVYKDIPGKLTAFQAAMKLKRVDPETADRWLALMEPTEKHSRRYEYSNGKVYWVNGFGDAVQFDP
jgi:hypothetical protein